MENNQLSQEEWEQAGYPSAAPSEKKKQKRGRIGIGWAILLCVFVGVLTSLGTALYYSCQYGALEPIAEAMDVVRENYYFYNDETEQNMITGALKGISSYIGDDYAAYYTEEEYQELLSSNSGSFIGMGVSVTQQDVGVFIIAAVFDNTPAKDAGILVGDQLISANGVSCEGMELTPFLENITHEEGDVNTVVVLRDGEELTFTVTMREVYSPYATYKMLDDKIGYIYISGFHGQVVTEVQNAVKELQAQGMEYLVLDVRDDLGGSLDAVCSIADVFLPRDAVITTVKSRVNAETVYKTTKDGVDIPIAMLVNDYSASASELLAGALKDNGVAELFGTTTYGKGIVQTFFYINLGADGTMKFTTDAYYTPSGVCIQGVGITPDHEVALPEDITYYSIPTIPYEQDTQLQAAVEYLKGLYP